jgi:chromosome segregation ATPase
VALARMILDLLRSRSGEIRAESAENLLQTFCNELALKKRGSAEQQLRQLLYEMAARKQVDIEFDDADADRITAVRTTEGHKDAEIARLMRKLSEMHQLVGQLRSTIQANAGDVEAAAGLVAEADQAREEAENALQLLSAEHAALAASVAERVALAQAGHPRAQDRRRITGLERQLAVAQTRIQQLVGRVKDLTKELDQLKARPKPTLDVHFRAQASEVQRIGCGCVVERTSTAACLYGGKDHAFAIIALTSGDMKAHAAAITRALKDFTGIEDQ